MTSPLLNESKQQDCEQQITPPSSQRPARLLVEALNELPVEILQHVSPESVRVQRLIKVPMLLLLIHSGLQGALSAIGLKLVGELFASNEVGS